MKTQIGHKTASGKRALSLASGAYLYASSRKVGFRVRLELKFDHQLKVYLADDIVKALNLDYSERPTSCWVWDRHVKSETTVRSMFKEAMAIIADDAVFEHAHLDSFADSDEYAELEEYDDLDEMLKPEPTSIWGAIKAIFVK